LVYSELPLDDALDPDLATELRTVSRAKVLSNHIGEQTPGLAKAIGKLTGKPWTREQYHTLHVNMWSREKAAMKSDYQVLIDTCRNDASLQVLWMI